MCDFRPEPDEFRISPLPNGYERSDTYNAETTDRIAQNIRQNLHLLGEDATREGLQKTPERVAKAMQFMTQGYHQDPKKILTSALFEEDYSEMILVKNIEFYSMCEHHMLPFFGKAHVAYIPNGRIVGLSKIPRVVNIFARRLQVQERMTLQIRDAIHEVLQPLGVAVVLEARHMCMMVRGVEKQDSSTITSAVSGEFMKEATRAEFMKLIRSHAGGL
ncbi:MAG TPA: GTP cyclohydrolase I FolE [Bacteroidetes bacterium]|nr:GTP cyclohydrolase I FolE [Bacteroidota bacterium]HRR09317.1 GTP cyclohydrolase I FolE [Rhodothermales bacterium]